MQIVNLYKNGICILIDIEAYHGKLNNPQHVVLILFYISFQLSTNQNKHQPYDYVLHTFT